LWLREKGNKLAERLKTGPMSVVGEPTNGKVKYQWAKEDLKLPDDYDFEVEIISNDEEKPKTVPNEGYYWLRVEEDLGDPP
jgi:hypothetical protein